MSAAAHARFSGLARALGADPGAAARAWHALSSAYASHARHYHTMKHIEACLDELDRLVPAEVGTDPIALALFWHDFVYDPTRHDNEEASAQALRESAGQMGIDADVVAEASHMILATKHDGAAPHFPLRTKYMLDVDLSILGADAATFDAYERAVRAEYAFVPDPMFRSGRAKILARLLGRARLYETPPFFDAYEKTARANLARSLAKLEPT